MLQMSAVTLKEDGNAKFKAGNYEEALSAYTDALQLGDIKDTDKAVIYKNRSMCNIKLEKFKEAIDDASECKFQIYLTSIMLLTDCFKSQIFFSTEGYKFCIALYFKVPAPQKVFDLIRNAYNIAQMKNCHY